MTEIEDSLVDELETARMALRRLRAPDAGPIALYVGDARVARMLAVVPHPYPPGAAEAFVERTLAGRRGEHVWIMDATRSGGAELIGLVGVRPQEGGAWRLAYWIGFPFWGLGYGSEAVSRVVAHMFDDAGAKRLEATVSTDNPAAAQVLGKLGFTRGAAVQEYSIARAELVEAWRYSLDREARA